MSTVAPKFYSSVFLKSRKILEDSNWDGSWACLMQKKGEGELASSRLMDRYSSWQLTGTGAGPLALALSWLPETVSSRKTNRLVCYLPSATGSGNPKWKRDTLLLGSRLTPQETGSHRMPGWTTGARPQETSGGPAAQATGSSHGRASHLVSACQPTTTCQQSELFKKKEKETSLRFSCPHSPWQRSP